MIVAEEVEVVLLASNSRNLVKQGRSIASLLYFCLKEVTSCPEYI